MKLKTLDNAIAEAERFIAAARTFRQRGRRIDSGRAADPWLEGGADAATAKRASMDLTRALSALRQRGD